MDKIEKEIEKIDINEIKRGIKAIKRKETSGYIYFDYGIVIVSLEEFLKRFNFWHKGGER